MRVLVRLHGELTRYLADGSDRAELELAEGSTVSAALEQLGLPSHEYWLHAINGAVAPVSTRLHAGDTLECVAPMSGG